MASKYYYKGQDINDMIATGTTTITSYGNFPAFATTNNTYDLVDVGFATAYMDGGAPFTTKRIKANYANANVTGNIAIPTWCNAVKLFAYSTKGQTGYKGQTGDKGQPGANGNFCDPNQSIQCQGGPTFQTSVGGQCPGGIGGEGGAGGAGGAGGEGGAGGAGGIGGYVNSNSVYIFNTGTTTIAADITANKVAILMNDGLHSTTLMAMCNNGNAGGMGNAGNKGGEGNAGNAGNNGSSNGGGCNYNAWNGWQANSGNGIAGNAGNAGNAGTDGTAGTAGTDGTKGTDGTSQFSVQYSQSQHTPVSFTPPETGSILTKGFADAPSFARVYFFRT